MKFSEGFLGVSMGLLVSASVFAANPSAAAIDTLQKQITQEQAEMHQAIAQQQATTQKAIGDMQKQIQGQITHLQTEMQAMQVQLTNEIKQVQTETVKPVAPGPAKK